MLESAILVLVLILVCLGAALLWYLRQMRLQMHANLLEVHGALESQLRGSLQAHMESLQACRDEHVRVRSEFRRLRRHLNWWLSTEPDSALPGNLAEAELLALARNLAALRPLVPYPTWQFDRDWDNPDLLYRLRRAVWNHFRGDPQAPELILDWHHGTKLALHLGNDLSKQIFVGGCMDPNELALLDKLLKPGMSFLDAGAMEGAYTVLAAALVGPGGVIWSVEPSARERRRLERNLERNGFRHVTVHPVALADSDGKAELKVARDEHSGQNTIGEVVYEQAREIMRETVEIRRLDSLADEYGLKALDVVKMDIEGAEYRALQGAEASIQRFRPVILLEVFDEALEKQGGSRALLLSWLKEHGYDFYVFDYATARLRPDDGRIAGDNLVAVPVEKPLPAEAFSLLPRA